jgi:hypothetical protein
MRSQVLAAAATLASALWADASAWAQEGPVRVVNIGMASAAPAFLAPSAELVTGAPPGDFYAGVLTSRLGDERAPLRSHAASTNPLPALRLETASWQRPGWATQWDMRSPYAGLATEGYFVGASLALSESLRLRAGRSISSAAPILEGYSPLPQNLASSLRLDERTTHITSAGVDWSFTDWAAIGVTASQTSEAGTVLGVSNATASADTAAVGISARVGFGDGWVTTMSYSEGVTQLDLSRAGIVGQLDPVRTQAYGLSIAKHGLFGDDVLGIAVTRPMQLYGGEFAAAFTPGAVGALRPNTAPESDIELGYVTTFLDGALALQANAAYQLNANGDKGQDAVSVLSRAKVRF